MDKKSKNLLFVFFTLIFIIVIFCFYKFYFQKDYLVRSEVECDPTAEKCFVSTCDPASDNECPEKLDERVSYYKFIEEKAYSVPLCDPNSADCPPLVCHGEKDCKEIICDDSTKTAEDECSDPEAYKASQGADSGADASDSANPAESVNATDSITNNEIN